VCCCCVFSPSERLRLFNNPHAQVFYSNLALFPFMYLQRIVRGVSLSFLFIILGGLLGYLFRKLLTSTLSIGEYGLFFSVVSFYSFFMLFIDLGLEQAATKHIVEFRLQKQYDKIRALSFTILFFQLSISLFLYLLVLVFADKIALSYFHTPAAVSALKLLGLWFVTTPFILFLAALLLGFQRTTWYTALDFFRMGFVVFVSALLLFLGKGIFSPVIAYALVQLVLFFCYFSYVYRFFPHIIPSSLSLSTFFDPALLRSVLSYGIFIAFANFGWILLTQTDTLFLTYFTSLEIVGFYNVALPLSLLLLFFMRPITIVFSPLATELVSEKKQETLSHAITLSYGYLFVLLLPCVALFLLFPTFLISFLFNSSYAAAAPAFQILTFGTFFYAFSQFNGIIFTSIGKVKQMALLVALVAVLNAVLNFFLIPLYSLQGAALATACSYLLLFFFSTITLRRSLPFVFPFKIWFWTALFGVLSFFAVFFLRSSFPIITFLPFILCSFVFALIYFGLVFWFRIIVFQEALGFFRKSL